MSQMKPISNLPVAKSSREKKLTSKYPHSSDCVWFHRPLTPAYARMSISPLPSSREGSHFTKCKGTTGHLQRERASHDLHVVYSGQNGITQVAHLSRFEESLADFQQAFKTLRGNQLIDYKALGLRYKLYACEVSDAVVFLLKIRQHLRNLRQ